MFSEIVLAVIQGITEFLPISSSGHLAFFSNLISTPSLFLFTILHIASLFAILVYFRKDVLGLMNVGRKRNWNSYLLLLIGIVPAGLFGYFFRDYIEFAIGSYLIIGICFFITGVVLILTKFSKIKFRKIRILDSLIIGFAQVLALFPGISRSGITTSTGMLRKIDGEVAGKFSFLMFIPLAIGAMILEFSEFYFSWDLLVAFVVCFFVSIGSLNLFFRIIKKGYFWIFGIYCFLIGIVSLILWIF